MIYITYILNQIRDWIWSAPLLLFILGTGVYLTWILKGMQFRYLGHAFREIFAKGENDEGDINPFQALMTTLAGAIGTGAIVGISTGIAIGGIGSLFWMWVCAFFSMAIKYAESLLAVKYREKDKRGEMIGGPMEYMEKGLNLRWLAILFAALGCMAALGMGNLVQVNSIAEAVNSIWTTNSWISGVVIAALTGMVIIGGVKSIGKIAGILVPFMSLFYLIAGLIIIFSHPGQIPGAFLLIIKSAFQGQAALGGFAGASIMAAIQMGVSRSVFSSEAGLGIPSIAAAAAKTDQPCRQALVNMTGTLISTIIICTITGLVIAMSGVLGTLDASGKMINGATMTIYAFKNSLGGGDYVVTIGLILFAFTTVIAWAYYGEKCAEYLFGEKAVIVYRIIYTLVIIPGAALELEFVWAFADIANALMTIPNLLALIWLSKVIVAETDDYILSLSKKKRAKQHGMA